MRFAVAELGPALRLVYRPRWVSDHHPWVPVNGAPWRYSHREVTETAVDGSVTVS
ncbi:hypothetical protein CLV40_11213 [Actinokineospora auranticolor]|uniref:Uncharacterized protein n=1 Tax=Actinokineospora auranticolor TaxID=155976 RepID=A0A2S6GKI4_9PSEU|nr:hypothetical protein CLV40_11213 [Actinokineospora auranticolor]